MKSCMKDQEKTKGKINKYICIYPLKCLKYFSIKEY
jgi:hypothetical protein